MSYDATNPHLTALMQLLTDLPPLKHGYLIFEYDYTCSSVQRRTLHSTPDSFLNTYILNTFLDFKNM